MYGIFIPIAIVALVLSCRTHTNDQALHDHEDHGHETNTLSYTLFSDGYELFVEFQPLVMGEERSFAAHFTRLDNYKPVTAGKLELILSNGSPVNTANADAPASPGIFRPSLTPVQTGEFTLAYRLMLGDSVVLFEIPGVRVFEDAHQAAHAAEQQEAEPSIVFLKEQAWKTDFATEEVVNQPFYEVIHTAAKVQFPPDGEMEVTAPANGTVALRVIPGQFVNRDETVAFISASGLENNIQVRKKELQIAWEKSRMDYRRTSPLAGSGLVSQKEFLEIMSRYQQDSINYFQFDGKLSDQGIKVSAPESGNITSVLVSGGAYVSTGAPLVRIGNSHQLMLTAFVNQSDYAKFRGIFDARFVLPSGAGSVKLSELQGKVKSSQPFVPGSSTRIPVTMTVVNDGRLIPGMTMEAFLLSGKKEQALVVPLTALMEEQGQYFVFVQTGGESFAKRPVMLAGNDGYMAEVVSGLKAGERIVTKGAIQLRLASLSGTLPLHGHTH